MRYILIFNILLMFTFILNSTPTNENFIISYKNFDFFLFLPEFKSTINEETYLSNKPVKKTIKSVKKNNKKSENEIKEASIKLNVKKKKKKKRKLSEEMRLLYVGKNLFNKNELKASEDSFMELLQKYPDSKYKDEVTYMLGQIMLKKKRYDEALMYFTKIVEDFKGSSYRGKAFYYSAYIYFIKKDYNKAIQLLSNMKYEFPGKNILYKGYILAGDIYIARGNIITGIEEYKQAIINKNRYSDEALFKLGKVYENNKEVRNLEEAVKYYKRIIDNYPDSEYYLSAKDRIEYIEKNFLNYR